MSTRKIKTLPATVEFDSLKVPFNTYPGASVEILRLKVNELIARIHELEEKKVDKAAGKIRR